MECFVRDVFGTERLDHICEGRRVRSKQHDSIRDLVPALNMLGIIERELDRSMQRLRGLLSR